MARKIRFPLKMKNGAEVRSLDELKENFDLESVLAYYASGQFITWLKNYNYDNTTAEAITKVEALDGNAPDISKQLCEILGIEYVKSENLKLDEAKEKLERDNLIKQFLTEEQMQCLATNQEELNELRYNGARTIYLAFGEFELLQPRVGDPGWQFNPEYVLLKETNPQIINIKGNLYWIMKYAEQGIPVAQAAAPYEINKDAFEKIFDIDSPNDNDLKRALDIIKWFEDESSKGIQEAFYRLDQMYNDLHLNLGTVKTLPTKNAILSEINKMAINWLKKKTENGDLNSQYCLAEMYYLEYENTESQKYYAQAKELLKDAAEKGEVNAQKRLNLLSLFDIL